MPEYKYDREKFPEIKRKILIQQIIVMGVIALGGIAFIIYDGVDVVRDWEVLLLTGIFWIIIFSVITYRAIKKQARNLEDFSIVIDDESITRTQTSSSLTIPIASISRISESKKGTLYIIGKNDTDVIMASIYVKDYEQLKAYLSDVKAFETTKSDLFWQKFGWIAIVLLFISIIAVFASDDKYVVGFAGIVTLGALGWTIIKIFQTSESNKSVRRMAYMLIFVIIAVLIKMFFTLPFLVDLFSHL